MDNIRPGALITARLRLVRRVGQGGMGAVWIAYHETLGTEVAVKFVDVAATKDNPKAIERFKREASIAAKLNNPHVAHTYDHGVLGNGTPYIVMELLQGESLQQRLKRGGALSLHETSLVLGQTAQALGKAHKMGIVHRDVKPGNLFLIDTDYELFVKLLDFGIAKAPTGGVTEAELTKTGNLLGSPLYMSPEQFTKVKSVDFRADLWSLAVVAYRCLANVPPFQGDAIGNIILAVMQQDYAAITAVKPGLPAALDVWFAKAFHKDITQRYQSAKELAIGFVEIARSATEPGGPRASLPSITEMTNAALEAGGSAEKARDETAELPASWRPPVSPSITEMLNGDTAKLTADVATFAPASTTLSEDEQGRRRLVGVLAGASVLLLASGLGFWAALGDGGETAAAPAMHPSVEGHPSATVQLRPVVTVEPEMTPMASASASTSTEPEPRPVVRPRPAAPPVVQRPPSVVRSPPPIRPPPTARPNADAFGKGWK